MVFVNIYESSLPKVFYQKDIFKYFLKIHVWNDFWNKGDF